MLASQGYAHPELLAEPDWLWEHHDDPSIRIIDCASLEKYERAHIPGAVALPVHPWIKEQDEGVHVMRSEAFAALMGSLGVSDDTTVVTYDDINTMFAARLWWVATYYGHSNIKILNGGWQRWVSEGQPITFHPTSPNPGSFTPRPNKSLICHLDYVLAKHQEPGTQVLDVLYEARYRGLDNPFGNKRVGHIPQAINLPIERFFINDDKRKFKSASELQALLAEVGLSPENEVIVHCQAGVRMTVGTFVLSLLGWSRVRSYDASMAEWANRDDTPLIVDSA
jgi:thiosulfate/3-mercaptopyruvate sulfurtransferase